MSHDIGICQIHLQKTAFFSPQHPDFETPLGFVTELNWFTDDDSHWLMYLKSIKNQTCKCGHLRVSNSLHLKDKDSRRCWSRVFSKWCSMFKMAKEILDQKCISIAQTLISMGPKKKSKTASAVKPLWEVLWLHLKHNYDSLITGHHASGNLILGSVSDTRKWMVKPFSNPWFEERHHSTNNKSAQNLWESSPENDFGGPFWRTRKLTSRPPPTTPLNRTKWPFCSVKIMPCSAARGSKNFNVGFLRWIAMKRPQSCWEEENQKANQSKKISWALQICLWRLLNQ